MPITFVTDKSVKLILFAPGLDYLLQNENMDKVKDADRAIDRDNRIIPIGKYAYQLLYHDGTKSKVGFFEIPSSVSMKHELQLR